MVLASATHHWMTSWTPGGVTPPVAPTGGGVRHARPIPVPKKLDPEMLRLVAEWLKIKRERRKLFAS